MKSTNDKKYGRAVYLYKRLLTYVKPFWPVLLLGIWANIFYSGIDAGLTFMLRPFLDKGLIAIDMDFVWKIPVILVLGISARGLVSSIGSYCI